jgi:hypothetical protein
MQTSKQELYEDWVEEINKDGYGPKICFEVGLYILTFTFFFRISTTFLPLKYHC